MSGICGEVFVVLAPFVGSDKSVIFGRNGLREPVDGSAVTEVHFHPASEATGPVKCDSVEIDDGVATLSVILNKPAGMWGAESGSNEKGVCIGLTFSEGFPVGGKLNPTDLVRLGLERSTSASAAVDTMTSLSAKYGPEGESKDSAKAAFVICDPNELWLLNIVGSLWAAQKVSDSGSLALKPGLSVFGSADLSSEDLSAKLQAAGLWDGSGDLKFAAVFGSESNRSWPGSEPSGEGLFGVTQMFETLRAAGAEGSALSSQVTVLSKEGLSCHWFTATPNPLESVFKPFIFTTGAKISPLTKVPDGESCSLLHKLHSNRKWENVGDLLKSLESTCVDEVDGFISKQSGDPSQELDELMKDCVEAEVKFYR
ncbi:secernin-2 [Uranotaenia lowii]|uniref:secernin-2 n=1 Tax=Uranotaenia lowii TaxID=190385 RepID=UPI0024785C96|nr:secernin-2 [Uranotaenia lowii]